jgi:hypothetical protein
MRGVISNMETTKEKNETSSNGLVEGDAAVSPPPQAPPRVSVDDKTIIAASYANFCRVTGTPEELIIDFGLNSQPSGVAVEPVQLAQRIVTNYFTAKRLLQALHLSVQRHEQAFGVLETDVNRRFSQASRGAAPSSSN